MSSDETAQPEKKRSRPTKAVVIGLASLLVLAGGAYGIGYAAAGDRTPRNASVAGIAIGGLSEAQAIEVLQRELGPKSTAPFTVQAGETSVQVLPADAGLGIDYEATVKASGVGRSADPRHIWKVLTGGSAGAAAVTVDDAKLASAVAAIAVEADKQPVSAAVKFDKNKVVTTKSVTGVTIDQGQSMEALKTAYLESTSVQFPAVTSEPDITDAEAAEAVTFAQALVSGPVTVKLSDGASYQVPVDHLTQSYSFVVTDGKLTPKLDGKKLYELSKAKLDALPTSRPTDARIEIRNGQPAVVAGVSGNRVEEAAFIKAVESVVAKTGAARTVTVPTVKAPSDYTSAEAEKAGVKEIVSEYTTQFPYAEYRNVNLSVAAGLMNNTYLRPGQQFSLNKEIGPRSPSQGFIDGYFIEGGILKKGLAGGISQSATTVYNAAFFAGVKIDQHQPHTLYFSRYPAGRESTVYYPTIDVKFTNDTPYGMVVQAFVTKAAPGGSGSITVRIWSTKYYNVQSAEPTKSNFTSGTTRYVNAPGCEYQAPIQGFTARYNRIVKKLDGTVAKNENYSWTYTPGDEIRCGTRP